MDLEHFTRMAIYQKSPISEWPKNDKNYQFISDGIKSKDIELFNGQAFKLSYEVEHDCDCKFCKKSTETESHYFFTKSIMDELIAKLDKPYTIDDDWYCLLAVKQEKKLDGLFMEAN